MFGIRTAPTSRSRDEAEKPFWISFADLMTAMMILFLVVMVASLSSLTKRIHDDQTLRDEHEKKIKSLCESLKNRAATINGSIEVDCAQKKIKFGKVGNFASNEFALKDDGKRAIQDIVPIILKVANSEEGRVLLKQVVVEGFTDTNGSYLHNLHLSLQRSEWVMCTLLDSRNPMQKSLTDAEREQIRLLFLAGGVSFNNAKMANGQVMMDDSRRVEFRMQFSGVKEDKPDEETTPKFFENPETETCKLPNFS